VITEDRLIVFVKLACPGNVKTRLAKKIGSDMAAALYRCSVSDTLAAVSRSGYPALVFFDPPDAHDAITDWLGCDMTFLPQKGKDLGERMLTAFREVLLNSSRVVLIGSDCPDLPPALLHEGFEALKTHQAVIGPAEDGGYYLIGFSSEGLTDEAFKGIEWGSSGVFEVTMSALGKTGVNVYVLPLWNDIDEYDDLKALYDRHRAFPPGELSTIDFLRDHFHW
jgi:uncharacterized protein